MWTSRTSRTPASTTPWEAPHDADVPLVPAYHRRRPVDHGPGAQPAPGRGRGRPGWPAGGPAHPGSVRAGAATRHRVPGSGGPLRRATGLRGRADPHRHLVRGRVAGDRRADPGDEPPEVPGRVPARADLTDPGRPDGRHLPAAVRGPAAAQ